MSVAILNKVFSVPQGEARIVLDYLLLAYLVIPLFTQQTLWLISIAVQTSDSGLFISGGA